MAESATGVQPFLKWAGGKRWLIPQLAPFFARLRGTYHEPFLGSAAVYLRYRPERAVLSDVNADLIECYTAIKDQPDAVKRHLRRLAGFHPDEEYYRVRASKPRSPAARAARFLYLNRTCWNGLYRVNLKGEFNVPRGTKSLIMLPGEDLKAVSAVLAPAKIFTEDFESVIDRAEAGDLVFADPPYTVAHNMNGFVKYNQSIFSWTDQVRLRDCLHRARSRGCSIVLSNADHDSVRALYEDFKDVTALSRASIIAASASSRKSTTELLVVHHG